jgi:hypothetical protein
VLDRLDSGTHPFSKGTLVASRQRLFVQLMDRRLLECTLEVAAAIGAFSVQQLREVLDRRPRWGAGRVEDPDNLLGHALRKSVGVLARQQGWELPAGDCEAGASLAGDRV